MSEITQKQVDDLISDIYRARDPETVNNRMVAQIFDFLNDVAKSIAKDLDNARDDIKDAQNGIDLNNKSLSDLRTKLSALTDRFDTLLSGNASEAIDTFNEIEAFLIGLKDSERLVDKLSELRTLITANRVAIKSAESAIDALRTSVANQGANIPMAYFSTANYFSKPSEGIGFTSSNFDDTADGSKIIEALKDGYAVVNLIIEGLREDTQTFQKIIAQPVTFFFADEDENLLQCTDIVFSYGSYKYLANIELEVDDEQCVQGSIYISRMALSSEINSLKASIENLERIVAPN